MSSERNEIRAAFLIDDLNTTAKRSKETLLKTFLAASRENSAVDIENIHFLVSSLFFKEQLESFSDKQIKVSSVRKAVLKMRAKKSGGVSIETLKTLYEREDDHPEEADKLESLRESYMKGLYPGVNTWGELLFLRILFLNGKTIVPDYFGFIASETVPILKSISEMNRYGYFTTQSQPGTCKEFRNIQNPSLKGTEKQRAFVDGFMEEALARRFSEEMFGLGYNVVAHVVSSDLEKAQMNAIPLKLFADGQLIDDPESLQYCVTNSNFDGEPYECETGFPFSEYSFDGFFWVYTQYLNRSLLRKLDEKLAFVSIAETKWCRTGKLFEDANKVLKKHSKPIM